MIPLKAAKEERKREKRVCIKCGYVSFYESICNHCSFIMRNERELKIFLKKKIPSMNLSKEKKEIWEKRAMKALKNLKNEGRKFRKVAIKENKRKFRKVFYILYVYREK